MSKVSILAKLIKAKESTNRLLISLRNLKQPKKAQSFIVSMTSHVGRFHSLESFFRNFELQELLPKQTILYLTQQDSIMLSTLDVYIPRFVTIRLCEDLGPGKKLIPALRDFPKSNIITVDDDVVYPKDLIKRLVSHSKDFPKNIIAGRAHNVTLDENLMPRKYSDWNQKVSVFNGSHKLLFPTGVGMVLYPPKSLHPDVFDTNVYLENCFFQDDIWFYIQAIRAGTEARLLPGDNQFEYLPETQLSGLWEVKNSKGGNDFAMESLLKKYGDLKFN
jgi:hypothetical protein